MASARALQDRILVARKRTLAWLDSLLQPQIAPGVRRFSFAHDPVAWPGMLLPGTYNGLLVATLLGQHAADPASTIRWLESQRRADGVFKIAGMVDDAVFKKPRLDETWQYIDFHVTNYTLGAIDTLDVNRPKRLDFVTPWCNPALLQQWLAVRDWDDPWQEGNSIVNLASFLLLRGSEAEDSLHTLLYELEAQQNPHTGFWGKHQEQGGTPLLHAFAGAMHSFHLWYIRDRPLPYQREAMDYALTLPHEPISACLDVDAVDLLFHGVRMTGHRSADVRPWMTAKLSTLLESQLSDGGFADVDEGELRFDGWVRGYCEPQGQSNTFATWFRWIAIAMMAEYLWPGWRAWLFRRMIGIGYAKLV